MCVLNTLLQKLYTKAERNNKMADEKGYKGNNSDSSLDDLLSLAFSKKKENHPEDNLDIKFGQGKKPAVYNKAAFSQEDTYDNGKYYQNGYYESDEYDENYEEDDYSSELDLSAIIAQAKSARNTPKNEEAPVKAYVTPVKSSVTDRSDDEEYDKDYYGDQYEDEYDDEYYDENSEFDGYVSESDYPDNEEYYDDEYEDDYEDYEEELSVEEMVAKAMAAEKNDNVKYVERVATENDAISEEELDELIADSDMYDSFVENEPHQKQKWYKNKKIIAAISICTAFIIICITIVGVFYSYYGKLRDDTVYKSQPGTQSEKHKDDTVDADDYDQWLKDQLAAIADNAMSDENVTNILVIAEDLRDTSNVDARGNTDVIILASINKNNETITLTSIMRDIYCEIPGYYADKINSAYAKGGPDTLMLTLQSNFGIVVDKYVIVNFETFIKIVEAIGGIEADVTDAEAYAMIAPMAEQNNLLGNKKGTDYLSEGGHYILNGNQALAYSRIRYNVGDDFGRTRRQREVIYTAANSIKELSLIEIKALADDILDNNLVKTNLTEGEVASLLLNSLTYLNYTQQELQIPADGTWTNITVRGMDCLSPNFIKNTQLIQETIYGSTNIETDPNNGEYTNTYSTATTSRQQYTNNYSTDEWTPPVTTPRQEITTPAPVTTTPAPATTPVTTPPQTTTTTQQTTPTTTPTTTSTPATTPEPEETASETTPSAQTTPQSEAPVQSSEQNSQENQSPSELAETPQ